MMNQANAPVPVNTGKEQIKILFLDEVHLKSIMWTVHIFEQKSVTCDITINALILFNVFV